MLVSLLLLVPFALFLARGKQTRDPSFVDRAILSVVSPMQRFVTWSIDGVHDGWTSYVALRGVKAENDSLKAQNDELKLRVQSLNETELENQRLRGLLAFSEQSVGHEVTARVIAVNPVAFPLSVRINAGSDQGVQQGAAVITSDGVVGQVIRVTARSADVMLMKDPDSRIAVRVQRSRARATAAGAGGDSETLSLENLLRTEDVQDGDVIVTSGTDGVFPAGLVVGKATGIQRKTSGNFQSGEIVPAVDITRLEEVLVLAPVEWSATAAATDGGVGEAAP